MSTETWNELQTLLEEFMIKTVRMPDGSERTFNRLDMIPDGPLRERLVPEKVEAYLSKFTDPRERESMESIFQLLSENYISKEELITSIKMSVQAALESVDETQRFSVYLSSIDPTANQGQSYLFNSAIGLLGDNVPPEKRARLEFYGNGIPEFTNENFDAHGHHALIIDDMSYSGSQHLGLLSRMYTGTARSIFERCQRTERDPPFSHDDPDVYVFDLSHYDTIFSGGITSNKFNDSCAFWIMFTGAFSFHNGEPRMFGMFKDGLRKFLETDIEFFRRAQETFRTNPDALAAHVGGKHFNIGLFRKAPMYTMSYRKMMTLFQQRNGLTLHLCVPFVAAKAELILKGIKSGGYANDFEMFDPLIRVELNYRKDKTFLAVNDGWIDLKKYKTGTILPVDHPARYMINQIAKLHQPNTFFENTDGNEIINPSSFAFLATKIPVIASSIASPILGCGIIPRTDALLSASDIVRTYDHRAHEVYGRLQNIRWRDEAADCAFLLILLIGSFTYNYDYNGFEWPISKEVSELLAQEFPAYRDFYNHLERDRLNWKPDVTDDMKMRIQRGMLATIQRVAEHYPHDFPYLLRNIRRIRKVRQHDPWISVSPYTFVTFVEFMGPLVKPSPAYHALRNPPTEEFLQRDFIARETNLEDYAPCQNVWKPVYKWSDDDFRAHAGFAHTPTTSFGRRRKGVVSFETFYKRYGHPNILRARQKYLMALEKL